MSKSKYLYIDDVEDSSTETIVDGLKSSGIIDVQYQCVTSFESQVSYLKKNLKSFNGLILDLMLDDNPTKTGAQYTAPSLAQELRSKSSQNSVNSVKNDVPIILCSTDKKIKKLYDRAQTSHDLFDYQFLKSESNDWDKTAKELHALAKGYITIKEHRLNSNIDQIISRSINELDTRIIGRFVDKETRFPVHEYALYIFKEIIDQPGILLDERRLGARLGIDINQSKDWSKLLNRFFKKTKYTGIFSDGWNRWWADLVLEKFTDLTQKRLAMLDAQERVELIKKSCRLKLLKPATPINKSSSTNFWTICEFYKEPLDPLEGFKVFSFKDLKDWQEPFYLSFDAAANRKGISQGLRIHPSEEERLAQHKKDLSSK